jgi:hypothetical protein
VHLPSTQYANAGTQGGVLVAGHVEQLLSALVLRFCCAESARLIGNAVPQLETQRLFS